MRAISHGHSWLLALSAGGFLVWNWPPARIFMSDVGSGFLGFVFGLLVLVAASREPLLSGHGLSCSEYS
jgi:Fuc2NAc and GlcNAc transferase